MIFSGMRCTTIVIRAQAAAPPAVGTPSKLFSDLHRISTPCPCSSCCMSSSDFTSVVAGQIERSTGRSRSSPERRAATPGQHLFRPRRHPYASPAFGFLVIMLPQRLAAGKFLQAVGRRIVSVRCDHCLRFVAVRSHSHGHGIDGLAASRESSRPAAASSRRMRLRVLSGACPARWRRRDL